MSLKIKYSTRSIRCFLLFLFIGLAPFATYARDPNLEDFRQLLLKLRVAKADTAKVNLELIIGRYYLNKRFELKNDLDSATLLSKQALDLSKSLNYLKGIGRSMLLNGEIYREAGDKKKSWQTINNAILFFQKNNLLEETGEAYTAIGQHFSNEGKELDRKINYYEMAVPLFQASGAKEKEATALKNLADFYQLKGNYVSGIRLLEKSLAIYKSIHHKDLQGVYGLLCSSYRFKGDFKLALQYGLMAEKIAVERGDSSLQYCSILNQIAITYYDLKINEKALNYFKKSLDIALKFKDTAYIKNVNRNIASLLLRLNKPAEAIEVLNFGDKDYKATTREEKILNNYMYLRAYMALKKMVLAKKYYEEMLLYYDSTGFSDPGMVYLHQGIITYLQQAGQYEKTYPYLERFTRYCDQQNNLIRKGQIALLYFRTDSALGKFPSAINYLKKHKLLSDSIFNVEKSKQFDALTLQFESDKKDKDIESLMQQDQLQKVEIKNGIILRYVFIVGLLVLILIIFLFYNRSRLKQKTNRALELKQAEINQQNDQLKKLLGEKEWLLKEIHHRVKNNFQIVISLLNTQSSYLENEDALTAIKNSQNRMHAMSLIHQKLYQSDNLAAIDMSWYIPELVNFMQDSFGDKKISFKIDSDKVELDVAQAVPLGLILNEAISNTIKYAFPDRERGQVFISLKKTEDTNYKLTISDNGIGLPESFSLENTTSLGMSLMQGLTDQLEGTLNIENKNGLSLSIVFSKAESMTDLDV